jgi:ADP-heptose:LPS heptosyltransferase
MKRIVLGNPLAIGDNLVLTTAIRHIHEQYPNKYQIGVSSYYPEVYLNNPDVTLFTKEEAKDIPIITVNYSEEFEFKKTSGKHFAQGYITFLNNELNLNIKLTDCIPSIYLSVEEIEDAKHLLDCNGIGDKFWVLSSGIKQDIPLKNYSAARWQEFVYEMNRLGIEVVQVGDDKAINPVLKGCHNLVGKLTLRQLFAVSALSYGMVGHVSLQMHLAAALKKSCIVVAGGRENISWNCYNNQKFISSVGQLDCCKDTACWKKDIKDCLNFNDTMAKCMWLISVDELVRQILKYENV